jgi:hypothetical protein
MNIFERKKSIGLENVYYIINRANEIHKTDRKIYNCPHALVQFHITEFIP